MIEVRSRDRLDVRRHLVTIDFASLHGRHANDLDGRQLLLRLRPDLRILFCTGRQHQYEMNGVLSKPNARLLVKPFDMAALAEKVRETLSLKA